MRQYIALLLGIWAVLSVFVSFSCYSGFGDANRSDGRGDAGQSDGPGDAGQSDGLGDAGQSDSLGDAGQSDGPRDAGQSEELSYTIDNYPNVDGSTSTEPLQVLIACKLLGVDYHWTDHFDGSNRLKADESAPETVEIADYINRNIIHRGTHGSYVNLIENGADLILVARQPSQDESDLARSNGVEMEIQAVALDAFVFVFNIGNPVEGLTTEQIQDIYTGVTVNWSEVGGNTADINPYQRDRNSGSQELMEALVMKDLEIIDAPDMILEGMMGPINVISTDENGIGYSVYFYEQFMAPNEQLKPVAIDGVMPNFENIKARAYPYTTEVYAAVRNDVDESSPAYGLWRWLLTAQGQDAVRESGYVPIE